MVTCSKFITEAEIEIRDNGCGIILSDEHGRHFDQSTWHKKKICMLL